MIITIAIDGPAAAGKGTISRALASYFTFAHLDTGLLYRAIGKKTSAGMDPIKAAQTLDIVDLMDDDLRSLAAGEAASHVATLPKVRTALIDFQRRFARRDGGAVLDGRDIGTVICPEAEVKLFVTASLESRATRRWKELGGDYAETLASMSERDLRDSQRISAPMRAADDAVTLDTSNMEIEESIAQAIKIVENHLKEGCLPR